MFARPDSELDRYRPRARAIVAAVAAAVALLLVVLVRGQLKRKTSLAGVYKGALPWLLLAPALASILVWSYYPLLRGMVMAFQDYKIVGKSSFTGLTNFIGIMLDPNFYHYIWTTFRFVVWNLVLAFFTPIVLAVMLAEAPRMKVFSRTLFFPPQMTSALVVTVVERGIGFHRPWVSSGHRVGAEPATNPASFGRMPPHAASETSGEGRLP